MKKKISMILTIAMCLSLCACGPNDRMKEQSGASTESGNRVSSDTKAPAAEHEHIYKDGVCEDCGALKPSEGLAFCLSDLGEHYILSSIGTCQDSDIVVPATYEGLPVKEIGAVGCDENRITSIMIPEGVELVNGNAFYNCENLTYVSIPDSVTFIGEAAFYLCKKLEKVDGCAGVNKIGSNAFTFCENLTTITLPDSVAVIGSAAFSYCVKLTNFEIPDGLTAISNNMLSNCESLTEVTIPDSVATIDTGAFAGCKGLTTVTIPADVTIVGKYVFSRSSLQHIYCEAKSLPADWNPDWAAGCDATIHWG